jgi:hypothetical protein
MMSDCDSRTPVERDKFIEALRQAYDLSQLVVTRNLTGGRSGAQVLLVEYMKAGGRQQLGVLKTTHEKAAFEDEIKGHSRAKGSWIGSIVAEVPVPAYVEGEHCMLSALSYPCEVQRRSPSLQTLLEEGECERAAAVIVALGEFYGSYTPNPDTLRRPATVYEWFTEILRPWASRAKCFDWNWWRFPDASVECFADGGRVRVNPLWCAFHASAWKPEVMSLDYDLQHGDLNPRNILTSPETTISHSAADLVRLIDFEKVRTTSVYFDLCWIALWLVFDSVEGRVQLSAPDWELLPDALIHRMLEDKRMERHDVIVRDPSAFKVGLDLVDKLFASLRASVGRRLEHPLLNNMLAVTLAAASLVMAYYELRNLTRGLWTRRDDVRSVHRRTSI